MKTKTSKGKEIRIPEPDHPITISPAEGRVRVTVAGSIVADGRFCWRSKDYEEPYEAVANIKKYLAFYPSRVDAIDLIS